jgi:O-antigen ligase
VKPPTDPTSRSLSGAATLVTVALLAAPVAIVRGNSGSAGDLLAPLYEPKATAVVILGAVLMIALAHRRCDSARVPRFVLAGMFGLCGAALVAALLSPFPGAALGGSVVRILLPLIGLSLGLARFPARRVVPVAIGAIATLLAIAALLEGLGFPAAANVINAPGVTLSHRSNLAFHLAIALPFLLCLAAEARGTERVLWIAAAGVVVTALVLTRCRTGWAAAVMGVSFAWLWTRWRPRLLCSVLALGAVFVLFAPTRYRADVGRRAAATVQTDDEAWNCRSQLWRDALSHVADRPWAGHGPGAFVALHTERLGVCRRDHPHNDLLTAAFEMGVPGAAALGLLTFGLPWLLVRNRRRLVGARAASLAGALVAGAAFGLTNSPLALAPSAAWYWIVFGTALQLVTRRAEAEPISAVPARPRTIAAVAVAAAIAFWLPGLAVSDAPPPREILPDIHMNRAGTHVSFLVSGEHGINVLRVRDGAVDTIRTDGTARYPIVSPDARQVAYETDDGLVVVERATGDRRTIASRRRGKRVPLAAAWSPDATRLAFRRTRAGGVDELVLVDVETGSARRLFSSRGVPVGPPSFAPDGLRIAFVSGFDLWIVPLDATKEPRRVRGPVRLQPRSASVPNGHDGPPAWSPEGTRIAYTVRAGGCPRIAVVHDVSHRAARLAVPTTCASSPRWHRGNWRFLALRWDRTGSALASLWSLPVHDHEQAWSGRVAFGGSVAVRWYAVDAAGNFVVAAARRGEPLALWRVTPWRKNEPGQPELLFVPDHARRATVTPNHGSAP